MIKYNLMGADELSQNIYFRKWVKGDLPPHDNFWENWEKANPDKALLIEEAKSLVIALDVAPILHFSQDEIKDGISKILIDTLPDRKKTVSWRTTIFRVAASLIVMSCIGLWLSSNSNQRNVILDKLSIADKKTIHTNKSSIAIFFTLPDGSKIKLGPGSELQYESDFGNIKREVSLKGEAFFDVSKDAERPFLVITDKLITKVIGTSFIIKAYDVDDEISVSVMTGKVTVIKHNSESNKSSYLSNEIILSPNQKAVFDKDHQLLFKTLVDSPLQINKTNGSFVFEETKIEDVYAILETYYGIDITYDRDMMSNCTITADLRGESLYEKLDLICEIIRAKYKITDGQIVITGIGCP